MLIGYHASHEQFAPSDLLDFVQEAEACGFQAIMTSDHIAPWSLRQGNSGNNWAWLGAAMAKTSLPIGSLAIPGGWRYHPVVLAHLIATLAQMFPQRLRWIALGSGEALNEHVVGGGWPEKGERNKRLLEGADIIRALLNGDEVTGAASHFDVDQAKLWSLPEKLPLLFGAALTGETAEWTGSWADGLVTVRKPAQELRTIVERFRAGGGNGKPLALQLQVSWAATKEDARLAAWDQWRNAAAPPASLSNLRLPQDFDAATSDVKPEAIDDVIPLITDGEELLGLISEAASCGFEEVFIHNVSRDQSGFLRFMGRAVIPFLA
ncbi:TIGR03885 family FMN-dependent LLM class oxidoreductase [Rhizobium deserti]|uniref:TIGR03885 family FMN-dependent LLM class oxidoreductase n=1 Tax=Rhizobium deserti TaxID=2547961 RepID=A0A4R5UBH8_9HYPH|nr:TIGR03885 family FMN-dependent LLM class oxidoreductase [Rhizobium deserti]TDK32230.1 TIGR03885 family FMN-dependent LLM class oxidoreductase [Rhizobium deserti]